MSQFTMTIDDATAATVAEAFIARYGATYAYDPAAETPEQFTQRAVGIYLEQVANAYLVAQAEAAALAAVTLPTVTL